MVKHPSDSAAPRSLRAHAIAATLVYGVDAFVFAQGALAGITLLVMVVLGLIHVVRGLIADRPRARFGLKTIAIYVIMMASVVATIQANNRLAARRADGLVVALESYKSRTGDYPARLSDLVPEYLPSVPLAKYTLLFNDFSYHHDLSERRGFLMYTVIPPFGRRTYWLDTGTWGYLD
ncbi:MAG: hypothetical protein ABJE95_18930 [Byssovorax sp.]